MALIAIASANSFAKDVTVIYPYPIYEDPDPSPSIPAAINSMAYLYNPYYPIGQNYPGDRGFTSGQINAIATQQAWQRQQLIDLQIQKQNALEFQRAMEIRQQWDAPSEFINPP